MKVVPKGMKAFGGTGPCEGRDSAWRGEGRGGSAAAALRCQRWATFQVVTFKMTRAVIQTAMGTVGFSVAHPF